MFFQVLTWKKKFFLNNNPIFQIICLPSESNGGDGQEKICAFDMKFKFFKLAKFTFIEMDKKHFCNSIWKILNGIIRIFYNKHYITGKW